MSVIIIIISPFVSSSMHVHTLHILCSGLDKVTAKFLYLSLPFPVFCEMERDNDGWNAVCSEQIHPSQFLQGCNYSSRSLRK